MYLLPNRSSKFAEVILQIVGVRMADGNGRICRQKVRGMPGTLRGSLPLYCTIIGSYVIIKSFNSDVTLNDLSESHLFVDLYSVHEDNSLGREIKNS